MALLAVTVFTMQNAFAEISGSAALTTAESQLKALVSPLLNVISILIGITGVVFVAINLPKYLKGGDREGENTLLKVGGGLIIAAVLVQVIKAVALT